MSESSYITKLREAQTIVASRFVPRVISPQMINNSFTLPNGFSINSTSPSTVDVNINGNLNVSGGLTSSFKDINFETLKSNTLCVDYISSCSTNSTIIVNSNLIPSNSTFTLGSEEKQWDTVFAKNFNCKELTVSDNTINVVDDDGNKMSISYDVTKGTSFFTTDDNVTVEAVTTSKNIPGQIDPSLLPFSGLSFASKINITEYKNNVGNSLSNLLLHAIYTLNKEVISTPFIIPNNIVEHNINKIIGQLNGNYYVVLNSNRSTEQILLPKIKASTNFSDTNATSLNITSLFTIEFEDLVDITDGDILIIYYSYVPNENDFDIIFGFQNINFRLPINSVSNTNILNNAVTTSKIQANAVTGSKIQNNTITENKLSNSSISLRTLSSEVINLFNNTTNIDELSSIICHCNNLENRVNNLEKFINIFAQTYFIKDTESDTLITLENVNDIIL